MKILASDFDGVICNGIEEYFYSSKLVYQQLWHDSEIIVDNFKAQFELLRPVVETGWEMPLLIKALTLGENPHNILLNWKSIRDKILTIIALDNIDIKLLTDSLDQVRKQQIKNNLNHWLNLHNFYPDIIAKLKSLLDKKISLYIITTKSAEFTHQLLEKQGINLEENYIIGKEVKRPKYETLRLIMSQEQVNPQDISFIEDRMEALDLVYQQRDLKEIKLFFALWGYNTELDRQKCQQKPYLHPLSLTDFTQGDLF